MAALFSALVGGCASAPVRVHPTGSEGGSWRAVLPGSEGGSWRAVLPGSAVSEALAASSRPDWIDSRRNASLSPHAFEPILATTAWPERDRPTLSRPRVVWVPRSPERYTYFRSTEERYEYRRGW